MTYRNQWRNSYKASSPCRTPSTCDNTWEYNCVHELKIIRMPRWQFIHWRLTSPNENEEESWKCRRNSRLTSRINRLTQSRTQKQVTCDTSTMHSGPKSKKAGQNMKVSIHFNKILGKGFSRSLIIKMKFNFQKTKWRI